MMEELPMDDLEVVEVLDGEEYLEEPPRHHIFLD